MHYILQRHKNNQCESLSKKRKNNSIDRKTSEISIESNKTGKNFHHFSTIIICCHIRWDGITFEIDHFEFRQFSQFTQYIPIINLKINIDEYNMAYISLCSVLPRSPLVLSDERYWIQSTNITVINFIYIFKWTSILLWFTSRICRFRLASRFPILWIPFWLTYSSFRLTRLWNPWNDRWCILHLILYRTPITVMTLAGRESTSRLIRLSRFSIILIWLAPRKSLFSFILLSRP